MTLGACRSSQASGWALSWLQETRGGAQDGCAKATAARRWHAGGAHDASAVLDANGVLDQLRALLEGAAEGRRAWAALHGGGAS